MLEKGKAIRKTKKKYQIFKCSERGNKSNEILAIKVYSKFIKSGYNI
jgi:hypothetical protein